MHKRAICLILLLVLLIFPFVVRAQGTPTCPDYDRDGKLTSLDFVYAIGTGQPFSELFPILHTIFEKYSVRCTSDIPLPHMRIAVRVSGVESLDFFEGYRTGPKQIPFIYYSNSNFAQTIYNRGVTQGPNSAEIGINIGCDDQTPSQVQSNLATFEATGVTHLIMDCEKGGQGSQPSWSLPDVPAVVRKLGPIVNSNGHNFRLQTGMQFGYLQNTYKNPSDPSQGDISVCTDPRDDYSCNIAQSFAGLVWQNYNANDIFAVFGQSGNQRTPDEFQQQNQWWLDFKAQSYPNNNWWAISGLIDKDGNGQVDLGPDVAVAIAKRAESMGAQAFVVVYLDPNRNLQDLTGPQTEMDQFLDLWSSR